MKNVPMIVIDEMHRTESTDGEYIEVIQKPIPVERGHIMNSVTQKKAKEQIEELLKVYDVNYIDFNVADNEYSINLVQPKSKDE